MELKWKIHKWDFNPTAAQLIETDPTAYCVMDVHRGTLIRQVALRIGVAFTPGKGETISIGDDTQVAGFMTAAEAALTVGLKNGAGIYLVTPDTGSGVSTNGKLYTGDDTIDLTYTGAADVVAGQCTVIVVYAELE